MIKLYEYQQEYFNCVKPNWIYDMDTGTGKTIMGLHHHQTYFKNKKLLIVAPASKISEGGWQRTIKTHYPQINYETCTYNMISKNYPNYRDYFVIFDECHRIKNSTGVWGKAAYNLTKISAGFILLSATPIPNGWEDSINYFKIFGLTKNKTQFIRNNAIVSLDNGYMEILGWKNEPKLKNMWNLISRRLSKDEAIDLPPLIFVDVYFKASAATTGASVGGVFGAVIGGIAGTIGVIATGLMNWNTENANVTAALEATSQIYENYKEQMDGIKSSLDSTIESSQRSVEIKMTEVAQAQELAAEMENFIDVNGRVKTGYEERANVILTTLNEALGTQLTLEGNVIKNGNEIIASKEQFINVINRSAEAIQKETLLQSYQAQYKAAIEAQTDAKTAYNKALQEEQKNLEAAISKYEENKITASELQKVYDDATAKTEEATKTYQGVLNDTNSIIDGLSTVTEKFANSSYDDMKSTIEGITTVNGKNLDAVESDYNATTASIKSMLDAAAAQTEEAQKSLDEMKEQNLMPTLDLDTAPAKRKWNSFADDINRSSAGSSLDIHVNKIPGYAVGGIIDKPTIAMVGEAGREAVMPLERNTGWIDELATKLTEKGGTGGTPVQLIVKLGEDTIFDKFYDDIRQRNFETNGEAFNL